MNTIKNANDTRREKALRVAIARGMAERGLRYDKEVAENIGVSDSTWSRYKSNGLLNMRIQDFLALVRFLRFTEQEVLDITGANRR